MTSVIQRKTISKPSTRRVRSHCATCHLKRGFPKKPAVRFYTPNTREMLGIPDIEQDKGERDNTKKGRSKLRKETQLGRFRDISVNFELNLIKFKF